MANRLTLLTSAAQTATANGQGFSVPSLKELTVGVVCTAISGTPTVTVYLQTSHDGGTTWSDMVADTVIQHQVTPSATSGTVTTNARNIGAFTTATAQATATYTKFGDMIRVAWHLSGSTSLTFSVKAVGK